MLDLLRYFGHVACPMLDNLMLVIEVTYRLLICQCLFGKKVPWPTERNISAAIN